MLLFLDFFNRYVRIRARVKIKVVGDFRYGILLIFYALQHTYKSVIYVKGCKFLAKMCFVCLVGMEKTSTFAPAIERDAAVIEILKAKLGSSKPLKKTFLKISSKKFGG